MKQCLKIYSFAKIFEFSRKTKSLYHPMSHKCETRFKNNTVLYTFLTFHVITFQSDIYIINSQFLNYVQ